jgi:hypothetical protein
VKLGTPINRPVSLINRKLMGWGQCSEIRQNHENQTSPIPSVFEKFSKNGENQKNSAETHRRRRRNSETGNTDKLAGLADKLAGFSENWRVISGRFVPKTN